MKDRVTEVRKLRNGVRVTLSDQDMLCFTQKDWKAFYLKEGDEVNAKELRHDLLLKQYPAALNRAVRLLAVRARSRSEIEHRLTGACYLADTVEMVLTKLTANGLLDDAAFARQWARDRAARQIGKTRILYELRHKGIENRLAEQAVSELDPALADDGAKKLAKKLQKRYQNLPARDARRKTIQAMQRRGYAYGEITAVLDCTIEDENGDF